MVVYDAILSEKRILMAGSLDYSIGQIIEYVFAASSLVAPLIRYPVFAYLPLHAMAMISEEPCFIAGVTNPMYLQNKRGHDLSCRVDIGKIMMTSGEDATPYERESYFKADLAFINSLISRIRQQTINDFEIRQAFFNYTKLMFDLARGKVNLTHQGRSMVELYERRLSRFR